ncbi:unnamed protein product [Bemisia tabaci]|uniref:Uncharacterized protein n=1 Tax=Bemisia tabaci TaxID=7038 RepID=A0A9P0AB06_BEMTA|nr:unnamed protein product [Bemisia tabaci]
MKNDLRILYTYSIYLIILIPELVTLVKCFPQANHFLQEQHKQTLMSKKQENENLLDRDRDLDMALKYKYSIDEENSPLDLLANLDRELLLEEPVYYPKYLKTHKRDENQVQRGWGAGGLPFNALYMSNSFKPVSTRSEQIYALPLSSQDQPRGEIMPPSAPHIEELRGYKPIQPPVKQKGSSRRFLTLPQLFLSYGWNSNRV